MKEWPQFNNPEKMEELIAAVRELFDGAFDITARDEPVDYQCYPSTADDPTHPASNFTPEAIEEATEAGIDRLDLVILSALMIGIEQGKRIKAADIRPALNKARTELEAALTLKKQPDITRKYATKALGSLRRI